MAEHEGALSELTVVNIGSGLDSAYAAKLLSDLGARVIVVEPPDGAPLRRRPPVGDGAAHGAIWAHLASGAESLVPTDRQDSRRVLRALLAHADVLLTDGTSHWQQDLPTAPHARLITADLSAWGRSGPYAEWRESDIATWAMGGYMYFTGEPDREPLIIPGSQSAIHAGVHCALAVLAAVRERRRSGHGQQIELSQLEANLSAHAWLVSSWIASGQALLRTGHDFTKTRDGWAHFMQMVPNPNVFLLIDQPERMGEVIANDIDRWRRAVTGVYREVEAWAQEVDSEEVATRAQELRVACTPMLDAAGLDRNPQLAARGWWEPDSDAELGELRFPGPAYQLSRAPARRGGPAARLGEHSAALREEFVGRAAPPAPSAMPTDTGPLEGLTVVELTSNWAGPIAGRHLGDLGANVIKVEWAARPATRALFMPGPTQDPQRYPYDRAMYFNLLNRNKRDVIVDLATAQGREVFSELIARADVFIENNSARVMPNLGLGYDAMSEVNPQLIYVSMSGFGATGPWRDWSAYGSNIEASSGLASVTGYDESQVYRTPVFYADPVAGNHAAVAILAALEERERSGLGQFIDVALNEAGACHFLEMLLDYQATGTIRRPNGNRDERFAPQGAYRCAGDDCWIGLAVQRDEEWPLLAEAIGREDLADDPELTTLAGRQARHDELDAAIQAWTQGYEQYEAAWILQRAGISAAPVLANWQVLADPHLFHRGFYVPIEHPVVGVYPFPSWPWRFSRTPALVRRAAPRFAEHNRQILSEIGLSEERIQQLYDDGITSDTPTAPTLVVRSGLSAPDD